MDGPHISPRASEIHALLSPKLLRPEMITTVTSLLQQMYSDPVSQQSSPWQRFTFGKVYSDPVSPVFRQPA